jgi:pyruvate formate-lyase activating enzyme-like uncharacterized protein
MAFNSIARDFDVQDTRELIGWAYSGMKWLSEAEAEKANRERKALRQSISGRINSYFLGNKIGPGKLSPGCVTCGTGTWSCIFIGSLCTADCFYCPQDRNNKKDKSPSESGLIFDKPEDYVDYLEKFKFKGVSFSGGEPFLQYKKVLLFMKKIRERLGNGIYIWLYTNGDLVTKNKLHALKEAGLNEIRFDIAARKYSLKPVEKAIGIIDKVTVEIPAIPEDYEILKKCLPRMKEIGVAHLNLHQLLASEHCYKNFIDRRYTFLHQAGIPVVESEMTALRIIKYAVDNNIELPINYCCVVYKHRFQKKAYRKRFQSFVREKYEELTEYGFIRRLAVKDTSVNLKAIVKSFRKDKSSDVLWSFNENNNELYFHHSLLENIDFRKQALVLTYFTPYLKSECNEEEGLGKIVLNMERNIFVEKKSAFEMTIKNPVAIRSFQELFIEKKINGDVFKRFYADYKLKTKSDVTAMMDEKEKLDYLKTWEFTGSGLYEIY